MIAKVGAGILPPYCPKGWHADKTFKKGSPNYASCIKGGKLKNHLNDVGFRKGNRGDAERLNTKNCNATEIKALNTAHLFLDKQWSKIKRETTKPTRTKDQNRKKKVKAVKAKRKHWKKLKKYITGQKAFQVECKSKKFCTKEGILGRDDNKARHVYVCVESHLDVPAEDKLAMKAELAGTLIHELAHTAKFPKDERKLHNCETVDKNGKKICTQDDETYQLDWATQYLYVAKSTKHLSKKVRSKVFKKLLKTKRSFRRHR